MCNGLLIVDDNPGMRALIRSFVQSIGYKVAGEAENGVQAIQRASELQPDMVLLDLSMPLLNGAEAAAVLKRKFPHLPIIFFTMYEFGDEIAAAVGVDVVLSKPRGIDQLESHLTHLLGPPPRLAISTPPPAVEPANPQECPRSESVFF